MLGRFEVPGEGSGRANFAGVSLTVEDGQGMHGRMALRRNREAGRGIHASRKENHAALRSTSFLPHRGTPARRRTPPAKTTAVNIPRKFVEPFVRIPRFSNASPRTEST